MIKHKSIILKEISIALRSSGAYLKEGIFLLTPPPPQHIWTYCSCTCKTLVKRDFIVQILIYVLDNLVRSTCMLKCLWKKSGERFLFCSCKTLKSICSSMINIKSCTLYDVHVNKIKKVQVEIVFRIEILKL